MVRVNFLSWHGQVEGKFAALHTSVGTVVNRLDRLDATVARQGDDTQQLMKSMKNNLSQLTAVMAQMPAMMTAVMAASMKDLKTVLVGVAGGPRKSSSGLLPQTQPQPQRPQNSNTRFAPNKPFGHVSLTNPPPSRAERYECKEVGYFELVLLTRFDIADQSRSFLSPSFAAWHIFFFKITLTAKT